MGITWGRFISLALAVLGQTPILGHAVEKLNVLRIISDDRRPEPGCYGSPLGKTPHIDALAATGVGFDPACCPFGACSEDGRNFASVDVRTETWRYAGFDGGKGGMMLLDPTADPDELENLADDPEYQRVRAELSGEESGAGAAAVPRD
jgi:arylsulfatase A-like enzyme